MNNNEHDNSETPTRMNAIETLIFITCMFLSGCATIYLLKVLFEYVGELV